MNAPSPRAQSVHEIKVTPQPDGDGAGMMALEWIDAAGAKKRETYHGAFAAEFRIDLHAATLMGEGARNAYLLGRIRELRRLRSD